MEKKAGALAQASRQLFKYWKRFEVLGEADWSSGSGLIHNFQLNHCP